MRKRKIKHREHREQGKQENKKMEAGFSVVRNRIEIEMSSRGNSSPMKSENHPTLYIVHIVHRLEGVCERAGPRLELLGAEIAPMNDNVVDEEMDWDSDDTLVDNRVVDALGKAALRTAS